MENFNTFNDANDPFLNLGNTLGSTDNLDNAFDAGQLNGLQNLNCITSQFGSLIILLIILYAWSNQNTTGYFMNSNSQIVCTLSCLLDKLVDNAIDNCKNCNNSGTAGANDNRRRRKHKKHKRCDDDCDCECDCDCE